MEKQSKRALSLFLAVCLTLMLAVPVFATEQNDNESDVVSRIRISFEQLPAAYQAIIEQDAEIYLNSDGTYEILQSAPLYQPNTVIQQASARGSTRYAPNGGSYSDLTNGWITSLTCVVYQTYLTRDDVDEWIAEQGPNYWNILISLGFEYGSSLINTIIEKFAEQTGITMSLTSVSHILNGIAVAGMLAMDVMNTINFNQVKSASNNGHNGVLVEYLTSIGSGNARVYSAWTDEPYVPYSPYGGSATWHAGDYAVMP